MCCRLKKIARRREKKALASRLEREASRRKLFAKDQSKEDGLADVSKAKMALNKLGSAGGGISMLDAAKLAKGEADLEMGIIEEKKEELFDDDLKNGDTIEQNIESLLDEIDRAEETKQSDGGDNQNFNDEHSLSSIDSDLKEVSNMFPLFYSHTRKRC